MKELIERLRGVQGLWAHDRTEAAAALERLSRDKMNLAADIMEVATLRDKLLRDRDEKIERLTAENQHKDDTILKMVQDYANLTAERDALKVKADKWQALAYQARKELAIIQLDVPHPSYALDVCIDAAIAKEQGNE